MKLLTKEQLPNGTKVRWNGKGKGTISHIETQIPTHINVRDAKTGCVHLVALDRIKIDDTIAKAVRATKREQKKARLTTASIVSTQPAS